MELKRHLIPKLKALRLSGILDTLEVRTQQAIAEQWTYGDFLERLLEDEVERRGQKQLAMRLRRATLNTSKTLETFVVQDETWIPAALKLVALPQVPEKFRARVNWVKEIVPYTKEATELLRANKPIPDALADKPLKAAEALVAALPYEGSILVARGWMNIREGHTPNLYKYVSPRRDAKTAPIIRALASLPPPKAQAVLP